MCAQYLILSLAKWWAYSTQWIILQEENREKYENRKYSEIKNKRDCRVTTKLLFQSCYFVCRFPFGAAQKDAENADRMGKTIV